MQLDAGTVSSTFCDYYYYSIPVCAVTVVDWSVIYWQRFGIESGKLPPHGWSGNE